MDKEVWNKRYASNKSVYGEEPNRFFKHFIDTHVQGKLLLPAEGVGRNAIYAATHGWEVDAFDFSETAREKALAAAEERNVSINYWLQDIGQFIANKKYDAIALIFVHLPEQLRVKFHKEVYQSLEPGGYVVMEAFSKEQIAFNSGGPKDVSLLYDKYSICEEFSLLHLHCCDEKEVELDEGAFHKGKASVIQLLGQLI